MRRVVASLLICALLAGCATKPDGDLDDQQCIPPSPGNIGGGGDDALAVLAAVLVIDLAWFAGCETVVGISNGIHHFHKAHARDGVYYSPDGAFSVAVPQAGEVQYQVQQEALAGKDTAVFVPPAPGEPVYGVTVLTRLDAAQAGLSAADFASHAGADLLGIGVPVTPIHAEDTQVGGNPAHLVVYRAAKGSGQPDFYLMYFIKTTSSAAIVSITWPYDCPRCGIGSDTALRDMDPGLKGFLESFELANKGAKD